MKHHNLKLMDEKRLKAYRRSVIAKIGGFEYCECCGGRCEFTLELLTSNPSYINLKIERERVNKELMSRQRLKYDAAVNHVNVITIAEERRLQRW